MVDLFGGGGVADIARHLMLPALALRGRRRRARPADPDQHAGVLRQDYVRTARAKGLTERSVIFGHVFRNAAR